MIHEAEWDGVSSLVGVEARRTEAVTGCGGVPLDCLLLFLNFGNLLIPIILNEIFIWILDTTEQGLYFIQRPGS